MNYLIDYENVNVEGLNGIELLDLDDKVDIFYSDKSDRIEIGMFDTLMKAPCGITMTKSEKTAPNYMDVQIICTAALMLAGECDSVAIISKDKGYISAKDFFLKKDRKIVLAETIRDAYRQYYGDKVEEGAIADFSKRLEKEETETYESLKKTTKKKEPEPIDKEAELKKKPCKKLSQTKKMTADDKANLKEMLKDLPKHNGRLQQVVIDCFDECSTLGAMKFKLVSEIGRCDGEKAYKIIEQKFAEYKGLELKTS